MAKVRHQATPEELQALVEYCEHTGHFYWKECHDLEFLDGYLNILWHHKKVGTRADRVFTINGKACKRITLFGGHMMAHKVAHMIKTGQRAGRVYHLDGNPSNNRWSNLSVESRSKAPPRPTSFNATIKGNKISFKNF